MSNSVLDALERAVRWAGFSRARPADAYLLGELREALADAWYWIDGAAEYYSERVDAAPGTDFSDSAADGAAALDRLAALLGPSPGREALYGSDWLRSLSKHASGAPSRETP